MGTTKLLMGCGLSCVACGSAPSFLPVGGMPFNKAAFLLVLGALLMALGAFLLVLDVFLQALGVFLQALGVFLLVLDVFLLAKN